MMEPKPTILKLPNRVVFKIFSRIPFPTLFQCRCVCKSWRRSLSNPVFAKYLLSRTPPSLLIKKSRSFFLVEPDLGGGDPNGVVIKLAEDPNSLIPHVEVVGSCNGFVVFRYYPGQFSISNPIIGEFLTLPRPSSKINYKFVCGFGFSPVSNVYKLVLVSIPNEGSDYDDGGREVKVLTAGSGIWRNIGLYVYPHWYNSSGVCVNGAIHWIVGIGPLKYAKSCVICAFDVETEQFLELPLPPASFLLKEVDIELGVLNGCLTLNVCYDLKISVWMMKDDGGKKSWTKEFAIRDYIGGKFRPHSHVPRVLKFAAEGQALLFMKHDLHAHNVGRRGLVRLQIDKLPSVVHGACVHTPSFLSLKHAIAS